MRVAVLAVLVWACTSAGAQTPSKRSSPEQTHFSAEDAKVSRPVRVPQGVLAIINKDEDVQATLESAGKKQLPANWLSASEVHLAGPDEKDFVVEAEGLLRGANVTRFWVFRLTNAGYELILDAPVADLVVMHSRSSGYRDIELLSATSDTVTTVDVKFDGKRYQIYKKKSEPIN